MLYQERVKIWQGTGKKRKGRCKRRLVIGRDPLQKGSFSVILRQKATAGVSLAVAFLLVLRRKSLFLKCFAVLQLRFFPAMNSEDAAILGVLQERGENCGEKDGRKTESIPTTNRLKQPVFYTPVKSKAGMKPSPTDSSSCT